ncbi:MAG: ABC transporter ATP-binding protein [Elusimicrobia bacterium]|nr:ABC transporter ATP-binding protein [Elusimicrobiota bacterium]
MHHSWPIAYQNAAKTYVSRHLWTARRKTGLAGLTLEIQQGEIFGLLGLNGAGKTTAMKLALGLLAPTAGAVRIFGYEPGDPKAKALCGYMPELPYIYSYLTPEQALAFYGRLSGIPPEQLSARVAEVLRQVGLEAAAGERLSGFSKGMLQRVALGQAIMHRPSLLLLDEPVSGLDPLAVKDFRDTITALNAAGTTVFLSSHSISQVEKLCRRVGIMKGGRLQKLVSRETWESADGGLEKIFVDTVSQ